LDSQFDLATRLRENGGQHQAALAFSSEVNSHRAKLSATDRVRFSLEAAEMLLDDEVTSFVSGHLESAEAALIQNIPHEWVARLTELKTRYFQAVCAYHQLLEVINRELQHARGESRERLDAIRDEARWMQGEYDLGTIT
jgi:hypothetical protein